MNQSSNLKPFKKTGLMPGSLVHVGKKKSESVKLSLFSYDEETSDDKEINDVSQIELTPDNKKVQWLNMDGIHKIDVIESIGKHFGLHNLLLEDVLNTNHRPKAEYYEDHMLFTLKMLGINKAGNRLVSEQVSFVLGKGYLISFQEQEGDIFDQVRNRIRTKKGKVRQKKADYLFYTLIDAVVDNYFLIIDRFSENVERLEDKIVESPNENTLKEIQLLKKQLILLRKSISPLREAVSSVVKDEIHLINEDSIKYLRDVYDHIIHLSENVETQRDIVSGLKDLYMSELSNRMNNTMKVLTIIATIFIPLTFVAGIYGMNFDNMPELHSQYGYPIVWGVMVVITIGMIIYFKKKKWL
jgi:magnesium transporter